MPRPSGSTEALVNLSRRHARGWFARLVAALLTLAGCTTGCATPEESPGGVGTSTAAVGGIGHRAIGVYDLRNHALCSGSLVAPNAVLTARHCVQLPTVGISDPRDFFVWAGDSDAHMSSRRDVSAIVSLGGTYDTLGDLAGRDIALLVLDGPLRANRSGLHRGALRSRVVLVEGLGATARGDLPGRLRRTEAPVIRASSNELFTTAVTCDGDSGGPAFDGSGRVVAVASFRGLGECGAGTSEFSRIEPHLGWLDAVIAEGPAACSHSGRCQVRLRCEGQGCLPGGARCSSPLDCASGICVEQSSFDRVCGRRCDPRLGASQCGGQQVCERQRDDTAFACRPRDDLAHPRLPRATVSDGVSGI